MYDISQESFIFPNNRFLLYFYFILIVCVYNAIFYRFHFRHSRSLLFIPRFRLFGSYFLFLPVFIAPMSTSKSKVWEFFEKLSDSTFVKCKLCQREYKHCYNTSNMRTHLIRKHPDELENVIAGATNVEAGSSCSDSSTKVRNSIKIFVITNLKNNYRPNSIGREK